MNQLDLLLQNSLAQLAMEASTDQAEVTESLSFATAAFFRESCWKSLDWHRAASGHKRTSHPGLSISHRQNQVAFGSSKTDDRDPATTLLVSPADCPILERKTAFLLQYSAPLTIFDVDCRRSATAKISPELEHELKRKLKRV
ncbi:MAG: hypothetical protein GX569_16260 [Candidatus Riflebacteria bacterium]|nr:hypothetical protein [Candidatus Riflebacteria bacterium]